MVLEKVQWTKVAGNYTSMHFNIKCVEISLIPKQMQNFRTNEMKAQWVKKFTITKRLDFGTFLQWNINLFNFHSLQNNLSQVKCNQSMQNVDSIIHGYCNIRKQDNLCKRYLLFLFFGVSTKLLLCIWWLMNFRVVIDFAHCLDKDVMYASFYQLTIDEYIMLLNIQRLLSGLDVSVRKLGVLLNLTDITL